MTSSGSAAASAPSLDEARELLVDAGFATGSEGSYVLTDIREVVVDGVALSAELERDAVQVLEHLVIEGEAPSGVVEAFQLVCRVNRERNERTKAEFLTEIAKHGARAVGMAVEAAGLQNDWAVMDAFMDAEIEHERLHARVPAPLTVMRTSGAVTVRARPRPRRRRRTTQARPDNDPDLDPPAGAAA